MNNPAVFTGSAAAAQAAHIMNVIKACGSLVEVHPEQFLEILNRSEQPLVIIAPGGFWSKKYKYLTSYRGLTFHCKSKQFLSIPADSELIQAEKISIPTM